MRYKLKKLTFFSTLLFISLPCFAAVEAPGRDDTLNMSKMVKNGSVEIYTETFGNEDDVPVLLIAGAMAPAVFWETCFCESLASQGYYVIRYDNRDIGKSTHFPPSEPGSGVKLPYSIDDMVLDAKAVLEARSNKSAHIVGHSLGGSIAQLFALSYPDKTLSLTVISSPILAKGKLPYVDTDPKITKKLWGVLMSNPMHQDVEKGLPEFRKIWRVLNGDWTLDEIMADEYTRSIYATEIMGPAWNHTNVQAGIRDILPELKRLKQPMLFIQGDEDYLPSNPQNTKILADSLPNAKAVFIKGGGHMFFNKELWLFIFKQLIGHIT